MGLFQHPPLPPWAAEAFFVALGDIGPFLLSQLAIATTYVCVYALGRELMPARSALVGTLLLAGVYYFSIPTPEFNHNVAQMPIWAAASYAYCRAVRSGRLHWWALLGLAGGLAVITKYATAVLFLAMLAHLLSRRKTAALLATPGPWLALTVLLAVAAPHLVWLVHNHFPTIGYAAGRAGHGGGVLHRIVEPFHFLVSQFAALLPCLVVAFAIGLPARPAAAAARPRRKFPAARLSGTGPRTHHRGAVAGVGFRHPRHVGRADVEPDRASHRRR